MVKKILVICRKPIDFFVGPLDREWMTEQDIKYRNARNEKGVISGKVINGNDFVAERDRS